MNRWRSPAERISLVGETIVDPFTFSLTVAVIPFLLLEFALTSEGIYLLHAIFAVMAFAYFLNKGIYPLTLKDSAPLMMSLGFLFISLVGWSLRFAVAETGVIGPLTIMAPITEEVFFRGVLFDIQISMVKHPLLVVMSALVNSVFFAVFHLGTSLLLYHAIKLQYLFMAWVFGMVSCILVYATRTLVPSIMLHMVINVVGVMKGGYVI